MNSFIPDHESVRRALRTVIDPELGCNIVDLGLIYRIDTGHHAVVVEMTLTTPGCPAGESLANGAKQALLGLEGVETAVVNVVWDPPWSLELLSPEARCQLGIDSSG